MFKNKTYDVLKVVAQIWGLPYGEQIVGTITAIDAFLGAILGISTVQYNKRQEVTDDEQ